MVALQILNNLTKDTNFFNNRNLARSTGIRHGFYHYSYPEYNSPEAEANFFSSLVADLQKGEVLALDFEEKYNGDHVDWVKRFLDTVSGHFYGYKPWLYINYNEATTHDWTPVINANYGLWLAIYDGNTGQNYPKVQWPTVAIKQWEDNAKVPGISGNVDGDIFYGDGAVFDKYGYNPPTPIVVSTTPNAQQLQEDINARDARITLLLTQLATANTQINTMQGQINTTEARLAADSSEQIILNTKINQLTNSLKDLTTIANGYITQIDTLKSDVATLDTKISSLTSVPPVQVPTGVSTDSPFTQFFNWLFRK